MDRSTTSISSRSGISSSHGHYHSTLIDGPATAAGAPLQGSGLRRFAPPDPPGGPSAPASGRAQRAQSTSKPPTRLPHQTARPATPEPDAGPSPPQAASCADKATATAAKEAAADAQTKTTAATQAARPRPSLSAQVVDHGAKRGGPRWRTLGTANTLESRFINTKRSLPADIEGLGVKRGGPRWRTLGTVNTLEHRLQQPINTCKDPCPPQAQRHGLGERDRRRPSGWVSSSVSWLAPTGTVKAFANAAAAPGEKACVGAMASGPPSSVAG